METDGNLVVTFIDFSAAFDTVSHKFIDRALAAAGATHKTRAMFRAIYRSATARTAVQAVDGATIMSDAFPVSRGVVQGDITSPINFFWLWSSFFDCMTPNQIEVCHSAIKSYIHLDMQMILRSSMGALT